MTDKTRQCEYAVTYAKDGKLNRWIVSEPFSDSALLKVMNEFTTSENVQLKHVRQVEISSQSNVRVIRTEELEYEIFAIANMVNPDRRQPHYDFLKNMIERILQEEEIEIEFFCDGESISMRCRNALILTDDCFAFDSCEMVIHRGHIVLGTMLLTPYDAEDEMECIADYSSNIFTQSIVNALEQ